jgi:hypothetical protein
MVIFDQFSVVKVSRPASLCGYIRLSCCTFCLLLVLMFCCYLRFELECNLRRFEFNGLRCWEPLKKCSNYVRDRSGLPGVERKIAPFH